MHARSSIRGVSRILCLTMIKYQAQITEIGPLITEFTEAGVLVFFGADAPDELREFAIIHDGQTLAQPVAAGDIFRLDRQSYRILAVGEVANTNLAALGHFIVKFNGEDAPEMPGDICTEALPVPELQVGMYFDITSQA